MQEGVAPGRISPCCRQVARASSAVCPQCTQCGATKGTIRAFVFRASGGSFSIPASGNDLNDIINADSGKETQFIRFYEELQTHAPKHRTETEGVKDRHDVSKAQA